MNIGLYYIKYSDDLALPDPDFLIYDCRGNTYVQEREAFHMFDFYSKGLHKVHDVCGLLSPRIHEKTGAWGKHIRYLVTEKPGADVYLLDNQLPLGYANFNVWQQGEKWHPGITDLARQLLDASGYSIDLLNFPRQKPPIVSYCNYWVGTPGFWDQYMGFLRPIIAEIAKDRDGNMHYYRRTSYDTVTHAWVPFIFERLLSTFLSLHPQFKTERFPCNFAGLPSEVNETMARIDRADAIGQYDQAFMADLMSMHERIYRTKRRS